MIVYLDLDRTLFQTARVKELWQQVAEGFEEFDAERFHAESDQYYVTVDDLYYHDVNAQLQASGYDPEAVYEFLLTSPIADGRLQYEGVDELIKGLQQRGFTPVILTFGSEDYQRLKAGLCPALLGLDIVTTLRPKAEFIEATEIECWVIDDKPIGEELSGVASFVQVSLEGQPVEEQLDWPVFTSLYDVKDFFEEVSEE